MPSDLILFDHLARPIPRAIPRPDFGEIASTRSALGILLDLYVWGQTYANPDDILLREARGRDIYIYNDMEDKDGRIASAMGIRKLAVLGLPVSILPAGETPADKELASWVKKVLFEQIDNFRQAIWDLLDALGKGYSTPEMVWALNGAGQIIPARIVGRPQYRFRFDLDENLRILSDSDLAEGFIPPERKFLVFSFQPRHGSKYGTSVLRACYWPYWFKKNVLKLWLVFCDKFGAPTIWGKYPPGSMANYVQELIDALEKFSNTHAIATPSNADIGLLEAQRGGTVNCYETLKDYCNKEITIRILGQLATSEGTPGKLGNEGTQERVRQDILEYDCEAVMEVLNHQLIPWIVDLNFGRLSNGYPQFKFHYEPPSDLLKETKRDETLFVKLGLPVGTRYLYDKYRVPEPTPEELKEGRLLAIPVSGPGGGSSPLVEFAETESPRLSRIRIDNDALFLQARQQALREYGLLTDQVLGLMDGKKKAWRQL